ncbi:uncharacterized protein LOC111685068 isoform X1 [Lucilia cuprina]|uniref:uncharacterized protein LOC111685068 isoform X1 n=1 Tax=Lucilia cuprina TaxID=7375 RepID=UPI001F0653EE|nr:uncharacterized protein LOC111685068 isoform X1 [Lucilia cuprina]
MDSDISLTDIDFCNEHSVEATIQSSTDDCKKKRPKQKSYRKKVESVWTHDNIIRLIEEVEARRCLWDAGCPEYKLPKDMLWQEVADSVNMSFNDCKGKWANLRTTFNCNLEKLRKKKSGQRTDESFQIVWKYFKPVLFLEAAKVRQSTQSISSLQLESATTDASILCNIGLNDESKPSGQQRNRKRDTTSSCSERKVDLKEMDIEALQSLQNSEPQTKDASTVFGEYIAAELRNLSTELAAIARAKLRRSLNDILDEVALIVPHQQQ